MKKGISLSTAKYLLHTFEIFMMNTTTTLLTGNVAIADLPPELLVQIFHCLDHSDLRNVEKVCVSWQKLLAFHFWMPHLQYLAASDPRLENRLETVGWRRDCFDFEIVKHVWKKLQCNERWEREPFIGEQMLYQYDTSEGRKAKVSACVLYLNKIFLSFVGGSVESRALEDFRLLKTLHEGSVVYNDQDPVLLTTPLAIYGNILVVPISSEDNLYLWNAQNEEQFCTLQLPAKSSKIYDVRINATHIVCLASWSLIAWSYEIDSEGGFAKIHLGPMIAYDCFPQSENSNQVNIWFETHNVEMNENYVVTHASQPLVTVFQNPNGQKTRSFLHCRKLNLSKEVSGGILGEIMKLNEDVVFQMEIGAIRLSSSKYNILALMHIDELMSPMCYAVKLMNIPSGEIISNVFQTRLLHSEVRMPISWVDNKLFMLLVPKVSIMDSLEEDAFEQKEQDVTLSLWNYQTNEESFLDHVNIVSIGDSFMVDHANVVQLFHRILRVNQDPEQNLCHEIRGRVYDYWNN